MEDSWSSTNSKHNKDSSNMFDVYQEEKSLIVYQDELHVDYFYIVNKKGLVVNEGKIQPDVESEGYAIPLKGLCYGYYTLYLCKDKHFWYGSFTLY